MKKGMKLVLAAVLFSSMIVCVPSRPAQASTYKGFSYSEAGNNKVRIDGYSGKKKTVITPQKINGKKVTEISSNAFAGNYRIKKLVISEGVEKIGNMALYDMQKLKRVSFPMTLKKLSWECGVNYYSEAFGAPKKIYTVVKGSPAFRYVVKKCSGSKIHVKKTNKVVLWFSANGGGGTPTAKVIKKGAKYKKLPSLKRNDYKFLGWYTKRKGGKKITVKTKAAKNQTVYAHWELTSLIRTLNRPQISDDSIQYDCVYFGNYYQSDITGKSKDRIKWRILKRSGNKVLLMADTVLDVRPFSENISQQTEEKVIWENSTLRSWLNGYSASENLAGINYETDNFCDSAFNSKEKSVIRRWEAENYRYTWGEYVISDGFSSEWEEGYIDSEEMETTSDRVFILDMSELEESSYGLSEDRARICTLSDYAKGKIIPSDSAPQMLLRSIYREDSLLSVGVEDGYVRDTQGFWEKACVRPVIYVDLSNNELWSKAGTVKVNL